MRSLFPCSACIVGDHANHVAPKNWWRALWAIVECPCRGECVDSEFVWWLREQEFER